MEDYFWIYSLASFISLLIAAGLGFIPANIAKRKGYSFWLWWFYGWMLFIVAIIHVSLIPDKLQNKTPMMQPSSPAANTTRQVREGDIIEELKKYKDLMDQGILTPEEFQAKKEQLLQYGQGEHI